MTPEELRARLRDPATSLEPELRALSESRQFELLHPIAIASQRDGPAFAAACLLHRLNPTCTLGCREAVAGLLAAWDVSIEEVPWYLARQFGRDAVLAECKSILSKDEEDLRRRIAQTIHYWVELCPDAD